MLNHTCQNNKHWEGPDQTAFSEAVTVCKGHFARHPVFKILDDYHAC